MPTIYRYHLQPMQTPAGLPRILLIVDTVCAGIIPLRAERHNREPVDIEDWEPTAWTVHHMHILYDFVGANTENVAVARPQGTTMGLTVIRD